MSEHVPAWKKIGLKQKAEPQRDTIKENVKRSLDASENGPKKPPKRVKKPKAERAPSPEPDQLAYLRKFHEDKENWKFSKQKQNWLLKNIFDIEAKYEDALRSYFADVKGLSRDRLVESGNAVIEEWNEFMSKPLEEEDEDEAKDDKGSQDSKEDSKAKDLKAKEDTKPKAKGKSEKAAEKKPPTELMAKRAQFFVEKLTGTRPQLVLTEND